MQQILRDAEANYSFTYMHKTIVEYIRKRLGAMVLSALYLASTISIITVSVVEPSRL